VSQKLINEYINSLKGAIEEISLDEFGRIVDILQEAQENARQVFIFGNGGSAATASHMACDLAKTASIPNKPCLRAISLTDNVPIMTAFANDISYDDIFVEQMSILWKQNDIAIGISASGNSPNVLKAIKYAQNHGGKTIGFCGFGGGKLAKIADMNIIFSSRNYGIVEDMHLILDHLIAEALKQQLGRMI
jgi:D-sedoheptulose 7-phosphate isomerase